MKNPVIDGQYELLRRLGKGGMAEVFLARHNGFAGISKLVVIKRILPKKAQNGDFITMFLDEARICADLSHPNVVQVFDINRADMTYYMAMEFIHGIDLRQLILKVLEKRVHIPIGVISKIISMAAAGLDHVHKKKSMHGIPLNIVHRDISPQNILVSFEGQTKIADFGIARAELQNFDARGRRLMGKYAYMSPEQALKQDLDGRSDLYALSIVFWEMLALRRLFHEKESSKTLERVRNPKIISPKRFRKDLPSSIELVLMKALSPDKNDRFADCDAFREALEDSLAENSMLFSPLQIAQYLKETFGSPENEKNLQKGQLSIEDIEMISAKEAQKYTANALKRNPIFDEDEKTEITRERKPKPKLKEKDANEPKTQDFKDTRDKILLNPNPNPKRLKSTKNKNSQKLKSGFILDKKKILIIFLSGVLLSLIISVSLLSLKKEVAFVIIDSEPSNATILINGKEVLSKTPYIFKGRVEDRMKIILQLEGYADREKLFIIEKKGQQKLLLELSEK